MKFSVVTIVRNGESHIERTIASVRAQTHRDFEYIFIDGASTDRTVEVAKSAYGGFTHFISEPDKGISDAWNKGINLAKGDVIALLNAGDEFYPDTLAKAALAFQGDADIVYGDTELVDEAGRLRLFNHGKFHPWMYSCGFGLYHPSVMVKRSIYEKIGVFDLHYKYAMDSSWMSRAVVAGAKFVHGQHRVKMVDGGISVQRRFAAYGEHLQAMQDAGLGERTVFLSMIASGLRGLARNLLKGERRF